METVEMVGVDCFHHHEPKGMGGIWPLSADLAIPWWIAAKRKTDIAQTILYAQNVAHQRGAVGTPWMDGGIRGEERISHLAEKSGEKFVENQDGGELSLL